MVHRITYAANRYASGLTDVKLNLYDPDNSQVVTNGGMTELGSTGIYYYDYTPTKTGTFSGYADSDSKLRKVLVSFEITSLAAGAGASGANYCTTLQLLEFMGLWDEIPAFVEGSSPVAEEVGTGDNSETVFYLDKNNVIASTYTFGYHADDPDSATTLTETTHYALDKDAGKLTLTSAGRTVVGTTKIYGWYKYSVIPDSVVDDFVERASRLIDNITNSSFTTNTATDEFHDGKGGQEKDYFVQNLPIISVTSVSTTQNDDETAAASTTYTSLTENDHFYVDTISGRISVTFVQYRPIRGRNRLKTTYTWGHSSIPVAVEEETIRLSAQKLTESTTAGGMVNAKIDIDPDKLTFTINDIKRNLSSYVYKPMDFS